MYKCKQCGETDKNKQPQTKYLQNAAYVRLKNIQLGYTIPGDLTKTIRIQKARIYVSGENLITLTNLIEVFDPDVSVSPKTGTEKLAAVVSDTAHLSGIRHFRRDQTGEIADFLETLAKKERKHEKL